MCICSAQGKIRYNSGIVLRISKKEFLLCPPIPESRIAQGKCIVLSSDIFCLQSRNRVCTRVVQSEPE